LVRQGDAAFGNQTGGPRDPQGPNSNAKQDVNPGAGVQPLDARAVDLDTVTAAVPSQLAPIVAQAKLLWARALGPDDRRLAALDDVQVLFGNLPRGELAVTVGNLILIDSDAAGRGWFIDPTPGQSEEFTDHRNGKGLRAPNSSPAFRRMDLLTTVAHELGHALGFQEVKAPGHVMAERLPPGERRLEFDALPVRMGAEPLSVTGSTNGVGRGFDVPEMRVDRTPRQNGARPMVDWDLGIDGVLTSLSPHGDERVKSALKPLVPAFTDGGSEGWTTDRRAGARRSGAAAAEHEETRDAVRLPSPGWEWRVEVGAARSRVSTSEREQIL
jgi:hypothetical protein